MKDGQAQGRRGHGDRVAGTQFRLGKAEGTGRTKLASRGKDSEQQSRDRQGLRRSLRLSQALRTEKGVDRKKKGRLTLCLQPESLNGHSTRAVLQLSFRWPGRSSLATVPTSHWLGQGTGNLGH